MYCGVGEKRFNEAKLRVCVFSTTLMESLLMFERLGVVVRLGHL